ncbi:MAG: EI24 domain-containing protein [Gallionella sp.]|jgi:hypothetical protein|nr:EI24 domain-containing protein [Gallionella sp.]
MNDVAVALGDALKGLFHPKMLALIIWPMLLASLLWGAAAMLFWSSWLTSLTALIQATPAEQWIAQGFFAVASHYLMTFVLIVLLVPAIYVTALLITTVFAMPAMVGHVAAKYYPALEHKRGGSVAGSVGNAALAITIYCLGWIVTLPLWLFTPFALILPLLLMAYLNQRLFRYDALAEHASREEFQQILERASTKLYLLGMLVGLLQFVPILNFFAPVFIGLAFIHLSLSELQRLRQEKDVSINPAAA